MNSNYEKNFLTGLFAGLAAGLLLATLILTVLLILVISRGSVSVMRGGHPQAGHSYKAPAVKAVPPAGKAAIAGNLPTRGNLNGPIIIEEFADFHCGFCSKVIPTVQKIMQNYGDKVRLTFRHYPLSRTPGEGTYLTHEAAVCAHRQGKFWQFHDAVFALNKSPEPSDLAAIAQKIGLNQAVYKNCVTKGEAREFLKQEAAAAQAAGISGTPSFMINGQVFAGAQPYENFEKIIKDVLSGKQPTGGTAPKPQQAQQPAPPKIANITDNDGRPSEGPKNAKVTLTIFSDFHCPFCEKLEPTIQQLMDNNKGKIRKVWRHFPLSFHAGADRTHQATECAHAQGKFWQYHKAVYALPASPAGDDDLKRLAGEIKLDKKKFEKCLADKNSAEAVNKDKQKGSEYGVQGTPAVFVNSQFVSGAQPYENFDRIVKSELAKK